MTLSMTKAHRDHRVFIITLVAKGLLGAVQIITAIAIYLGVLSQLPRFVHWLAAPKLAQDPDDFLASQIVALANIAPSTHESFYIAYFAVHGVLHLGVVTALLWGAKGAHHVAVAALSAFILYQVVEWGLNGGIMLLVLSAVDLFVIFLTMREYRAQKSGALR